MGKWVKVNEKTTKQSGELKIKSQHFTVMKPFQPGKDNITP